MIDNKDLVRVISNLAVRAAKRIISKGQSECSVRHFVKPANDGAVSFFVNGTPEAFVSIVPVSGIKTIIADHFVVMFRDVLDKQS